MVSTILVGVLLALVGQTYQTGADTWQLFFYWAILGFFNVYLRFIPYLGSDLGFY